MVFAVMMVMTISASALSSSKARRYSLYLSDKMAYELDLTADQYEAVYQINYDYFRQVYTQFDVDIYWPERDLNMYYVLDWYQYEIYSLIDYFYNPITLTGSKWYLDVYSYYPSRYVFYRDRPLVYRSYRGYYMTNPGYYRTITYTHPVHYGNMHYTITPPPQPYAGAARHWGVRTNGNPYYPVVNPIQPNRPGYTIGNNTNNGNPGRGTNTNQNNNNVGNNNPVHVASPTSRPNVVNNSGNNRNNNTNANTSRTNVISNTSGGGNNNRNTSVRSSVTRATLVRSRTRAT